MLRLKLNTLPSRVLVILCLLFAINAAMPGVCFAANHYIRDGASGAADGSNWIDAWDNLPATFTRGDTYWIADGIYEVASDKRFNTANSGTDTITIKKAVDGAQNGDDDANWVSTWGDGQAVFRYTTGDGKQLWWIATDYWIFDGQVGGGPNDWDGSEIPYGFKLTGPTDQDLSENQELVRLCETNASAVADNIEFRHIEVTMTDYVPAVSDEVLFCGQISNASENNPGRDGCHNILFDSCYFHDSHNAMKIEDGNGITINKCYFKNIDHDDVEGAPLQCSVLRIQNCDNVTVSNNLFEDAANGSGSLWFVSGDSVGGVNEPNFTNVYVYGNVWWNSNEDEYGVNAGVMAVTGDTGDGDSITNLVIANNSFVNLQASNGYVGIGVLTDTHSGVIIENNIFYNVNNTGDNPADFFKLTGAGSAIIDNNWYYDCTFAGVNQDTWLASQETSAQVGTTDPFADSANGDFSLTASTNAGINLSWMNDKDMFGNTRGADGILDRGAIEYVSDSPDTTPPEIISVTVHSPVHILFSEPLDVNSATNTLNYDIESNNVNEPNIIIYSATLDTDQRMVILDTSDHTEGVDYTLTVIGVKDLSGNAVEGATYTYQYNSNLIGHWKFDDGSGTSAADSSGNNTGTLKNGPTWTTGKINGALNFDGTNDYVEVPDGPSFDITDEITISAWINPVDISSYDTILSKFAHTPNSRKDLYWFLYNGRIGAYLAGPSGIPSPDWTPDVPIQTGLWTHVALTYNGTTMTMYKNGIDAASINVSGTLLLGDPSSSESFFIGRNSEWGEYFDGLIDEVHIYDRALSADEILVLFNEADSFVFSTGGNKEVDEGSKLTFDVNTTDPNIVVDVNYHNLPSDPDFFPNGGGGWSFGWTPTYNDAGIYEVTFEAIYGEFIDSETITITVNNVNRAPEIEPINDITADEGSLITFVVSASDPDGNDITCYCDNPPTGSSFENYTFEWTPGYDQAGTHVMSFVATDGELEDVEGVTITINDADNQPPIANAGSNQTVTDTDRNGSEQVTLNASGSEDPDGSIVSYIWTEGGNQIAIGVNPMVIMTVGTHTITLTVTDDDGATDTDTVTIMVVPPANQAPVINSVTATPPEILENETSQLQVLAYDPDGGPGGLSYSWTIQGGAGSLSNSNIANPVYTPPDVNNTLIVTLTIRVSDGELEDFEIITIKVKKVNWSPILETIGDKSVNENSLLSFSISATDADGDTITYSAQNLPFGATFIGQTFSWTPSSGQAGTYQVTFIASDGQDTDSETITITVNSINVDLLFLDNFSDKDYSGWNIVDEGERDAPSSWSASTGTMIQSTNIYSLPTGLELPKQGTYAWYTGGTDWTDYRTTLTIRSEDDDAIGLMFRYQDNENYYRFSWDSQRNYRRLIKKVNGDVSLLDEDAVQYVTGQNYQIEVIAQGSTLELSVNGTLIFSETDGSLVSGTIALYNWGNIGSYFDDILVEELPYINQAPLISSVTATPSTISDVGQTSQLLVTASDPDSGPYDLTYNWTVQAGEGSISNANVANPVYTPPDVDSSQTFTLTVEVSDGEDTANSKVDVTIIDNAVTMPDVVGMSEEDAEDAIVDAGLTVGTITNAYSNTVELGNIISQNPAANTSVEINSAVDLVVSDGPPADEEIIIDNGDDGTSYTGTWYASVGAGFYGDNSLYSKDSGASYSFEAPVHGTRVVSLWWTSRDSRSAQVPVQIYDDDTLLDTIIVNQQINGAKWNILGTYSFRGQAKVKITAQFVNGDNICADAVRFALNVPSEIIIDNGDKGTSYTGTWYASVGVGFYGDNSLYSKDSGASYSFEAPIDDTRVVSLWWTCRDSRSAQVPVQIYDGDTLLDTIIVNQKIDGAKWNILGTYSFSSQAKVKIIAQFVNGDNVCADALRFAP